MIPEKLREISELAHREHQEPKETVRTFIQWFGAKRRGYAVVRQIRRALDELRLVTEPDFETAYIDSTIRFRALTSEGSPPGAAPVTITDSDSATLSDDTTATMLPQSPILVTGAVEDPTFRVGQLESANRPPVAVSQDSTLIQATTLMLLYDYSQLPVMQGERTVKGVVSWRSIGKASALGRSCDLVRGCMETSVPVVPASDSLFSVINIIINNEYVLVKQADNRICGIVTTSDLSHQFRRLAEPFLIVGEIENYIRRLIDGQFTGPQLEAVRDPGDDRPINNVADLTFGEYVRLLEDPENWAYLKLPIDRAEFIKALDRVRALRNEVMHFAPDPFEAEDLEALRQFVGFMRDLIPHRRPQAGPSDRTSG